MTEMYKKEETSCPHYHQIHELYKHQVIEVLIDHVLTFIKASTHRRSL